MNIIDKIQNYANNQASGEKSSNKAPTFLVITTLLIVLYLFILSAVSDPHYCNESTLFTLCPLGFFAKELPLLTIQTAINSPEVHFIFYGMTVTAFIAVSIKLLTQKSKK